MTQPRKRRGAPGADDADEVAEDFAAADADAVAAAIASVEAIPGGGGGPPPPPPPPADVAPMPDLPEPPHPAAAAAAAAEAPPDDPADPPAAPPPTQAAAAAGYDPAGREPKPKRQRLTWQDRYDQLRDFKEKHGHCLVTIRYKDNPTLGKWVNNQREQYKLYVRRQQLLAERKDDKDLPKCPMDEKRVRDLEEIGFAWATNRHEGFDEAWEARLSELVAYKERHGDCLVPHGYQPNPSLAEWVHRQRCTWVLYHKGRIRQNRKADRDNLAMFKARFDRLEEVGFAFKVKEGSWGDRLEELRAYREAYGDCNVPISYQENPALGRWVHTQRHQYKLYVEKRNDGKRSSKSSMNPDRIKALEEVGFSWEVRSVRGPKMSWEERFEELKAFRVKEGHTSVPTGAPYVALNRWCNDQKVGLKALQEDPADPGARKRLGPERVELLASVGFDATSAVPTAAAGGAGEGGTGPPAADADGAAADGAAAATVEAAAAAAAAEATADAVEAAVASVEQIGSV